MASFFGSEKLKLKQTIIQSAEFVKFMDTHKNSSRRQHNNPADG